MLPISAHFATFLLCVPFPTGDRVELRAGGVVEGAIVAEDEHTITLEIVRGARMEVAKSDVKSVIRAPKEAASAESRPASRPAQGDAAREAIFLLRNGRQDVVGTRRVTVGFDSSRPEHIRLEDSMVLREPDGQTTRVTRIEIADGELHPIECQYREVTDRVAVTVRGTVTPDGLDVEYLDPSGRTHEIVPFAAGTTFPLLSQEAERRNPVALGECRTVAVFDAFVRSVLTRKLRGEAPRLLALGSDAPASFRVVSTASRGVDSAAWIDAAGVPMREELNGADLVAVRCRPEEAEQALLTQSGAMQIQDAAGRVTMSVSTADWRTERSSDDVFILSRRDFAGKLVACPVDAEKEATAGGCAMIAERRLRTDLSGYERTGGFADASIGAFTTNRFDFRCSEDGAARAGTAVVVRGASCAWAFVMTYDPLEKTRAQLELDRLLLRADLKL